MSVRRKHIRAKVKELIGSSTKKGAMPINVGKIAKDLGITVLFEPNDDDVSGFLLRDVKKNKTVIGVNESHHPNRQRFTIAHELGHYFLHDYEGFHFDRQNRGLQLRKQFRDKNSSSGTDIEEKEANLFAAELLMPEEFIREDLERIESIDLFSEDQLPLDEMAKRYQVSTQALIYRLTSLGFIH